MQAARDVVAVVKATGQCMPLAHVVDVFKGANTRSVKAKRHEGLPEHGLGKAYRCVPPHRTSLCAGVVSAFFAPFWHFFGPLCPFFAQHLLGVQIWEGVLHNLPAAAESIAGSAARDIV